MNSVEKKSNSVITSDAIMLGAEELIDLRLQWLSVPEMHLLFVARFLQFAIHSGVYEQNQSIQCGNS